MGDTTCLRVSVEIRGDAEPSTTAFARERWKRGTVSEGELMGWGTGLRVRGFGLRTFLSRVYEKMLGDQ